MKAERLKELRAIANEGEEFVPNASIIAELLIEFELSHTENTQQLVSMFNQGYLSGHHDTVEGDYTDIVVSDMNTYHKDVVDDIIAEESKKPIGVACQKHDLCHSIACGRCFADLETKLKAYENRDITDKNDNCPDIRCWVQEERDRLIDKIAGLELLGLGLEANRTVID